METFQLMIEKKNNNYKIDMKNMGFNEIELIFFLENITSEFRKKKENEFLLVFKEDHG